MLDTSDGEVKSREGELTGLEGRLPEGPRELGADELEGACLGVLSEEERGFAPARRPVTGFGAAS